MTTLTKEQWLDMANVLKHTDCSSVERIYQWVFMCERLVNSMGLSSEDKDTFLTACGFDEMIGHYDWRSEFC